MIIEDENLYPFFIKVSDSSFDVYELKERSGKSKNAGDPFESVIGYYTTLTGALKKIAKLKIVREGIESSDVFIFIGAILLGSIL